MSGKFNHILFAAQKNLRVDSCESHKVQYIKILRKSAYTRELVNSQSMGLLTTGMFSNIMVYSKSETPVLGSYYLFWA